MVAMLFLLIGPARASYSARHTNATRYRRASHVGNASPRETIDAT